MYSASRDSLEYSFKIYNNSSAPNAINVSDVVIKLYLDESDTNIYKEFTHTFGAGEGHIEAGNMITATGSISDNDKATIFNDFCDWDLVSTNYTPANN